MIIKPSTLLRNDYSKVSNMVRESAEPMYITKNGVGDMVVLSVETYERQQAQLELYAKLAEAEAEIASGAESMDFFEFANKLRADVHGSV